MPVTRLRQLAPLIQTAGRKISAELGYQSAFSVSQSATGTRNGKAGTNASNIAV